MMCLLLGCKNTPICCKFVLGAHLESTSFQIFIHVHCLEFFATHVYLFKKRVLGTTLQHRNIPQYRCLPNYLKSLRIWRAGCSRLFALIISQF